MLGHDLRNPLAAMIATAQALARRGGDDRVSDSARRIVATGQRMSRMIEQLLDFTRLRLGSGLAIQPTEIDLADLARRIVREVEETHGRTFVIDVRGSAVGRWDSDRLAQLVSNLAGNAVQHGSPTGGLRMRLDGGDAATVRLSFENDGTIPGDVLPVLFDPFRSTRITETRSRGLGLGLFITREIAVAHGGDVLVSSSDGVTRFEVVLPRHADARPTHERGPQPR